MPRYATIITGDDGHHIVSAIGVFEGTAKPRRPGCVEEVAPGVLIGMVRGGPLDAVGGFGFALGSTVIGIASKPGVAKPAALLGEAASSGDAPAGAKPARPARKPAKSTGKRKPVRRKTARPGAHAAPAQADTNTAAPGQAAGDPSHG